MKAHTKNIVGILCLALTASLPAAGLAPGDKVKITLRGVPSDDQTRINGEYSLSDNGNLRMPSINEDISAKGLTRDELARKIELAYRKSEIYTSPTIEVEILNGANKNDEGTFVTIGGNVRTAGKVPFRKGMTLMEAIQGAGDRNEFGGPRIELRRDGKLHKIDYRQEEGKNFIIEPNDNIRVLEIKLGEGRG
jgi:protein involved in polysaccharide export with SLBB domain